MAAGGSVEVEGGGWGGSNWRLPGGLFSVSSPGGQQADSHTGAQASTTVHQDGDHRSLLLYL